jgi:hypothetical protein
MTKALAFLVALNSPHFLHSMWPALLSVAVNATAGGEKRVLPSG